ncbi:putative ribonuclease H-like domain-containing protein [Tanacetum coccineum]
MYSFFANQSNSPQLDHEDLEQINEYDLEEMDLKWQVAMISMRLKKFYKKTRRKLHFDAKEPIGFDKTKVECYYCHKTGHFARECRSKASQDAKRKDAGSYGYKVKDNGRIQGKNEEPNALVTLDGKGIDWTAHTEDEEQDFALMAFNNASSDTKVISCSTKCVESYSKLKKLYDEQRKQLSDANVEILAYSQGLKKVEAQLVTHQNNQLWYEQKIRFVTAGGMHAVPPPMRGNYMPSGPDIEIDESQFTYGPKQPQSSEPDTRSSYFESCESTSSVETPDCVTVPVVTDPKVVNTPKVWNDAPIIEEYESDSDDECVSTPLSEQEQPRETVQEHKTCNQNPKVNKKDLNGSKSTRMGLGYGGTRKGSYVCGSFSHLIRDCDYHEKRMAKQAAMNKNMSKSTNKKENRPIWNNVQRVNHLNQFVPSAVLTRSGKISINTARTSSTNHVNTARQNVSTARQNSSSQSDDPQRALKHKGIVDSGCSRHMTGNKGYLVDYQDYNGGPVAFGGSKGQITGKGKIRTRKLDFDDVCFVKELQQFNFFSVSQMCDKKNKVLFTDTEYLMLSPNFKLSDENQSSEGKDGDKKSHKDDVLKSKQKPVDVEEQAFLEELERLKSQEKEANDTAEALRKELDKSTDDLLQQARFDKATSTNSVSTASAPVSTANTPVSTDSVFSTGEPSANYDDSQIPPLEDIHDNPSEGIFTSSSYDDEDPTSAVQTRSKVIKSSGSHAFVDAMQEELLQFKIQKVWILVDLPKGKKTIRLKWVYRNKKDERGVVVRNKARLVAQGHRQEEGIDYDEVFAPVARIEAITIFLAFASYMGFIVYLMDVKSAFLYCTIDEEVYVSQPPGFIDPMYPKKVYKVVKALYGLHQAPRAWYATLSNFLLKNGYRRGAIDKTLFIKKDKKDIFLMSSMGELTFFLGLQVKQKKDGIFISQDKSMIGSLMYLTASRPDIMFAVCNCSRFQVTPKTSHLNVVERIFRYLKGKPKLGLWYPRVSPFDLEAYSDSDYVGANLDRKSTTGGCQFLGRRLISWQCKKQTIVATSITEAEYVAAASCCGQVLWIQNQMLDHGFNFMNTKIHIDNESTICIVKNPVFHSKTKHIEIRHHFIRDAFEKKLIQVLKIHTDDNVADLLTKAFDAGSSIHYALTVSPVVSTTFIEQFWMSAKSKIIDNIRNITAKVAGKPVTISEASIRSSLLFDDADGIDSLINQAIFDAIQQMGYEGDLIVLTFNKAQFSPQWRFFFHTMNHCISSKSTSWDQIPTNIATAVICLSTNQKYNFSKLIFDGMLRHLDAKKKFVMYPRFISILLDTQLKDVPVPVDHFPVHALTSKVFSFMVKKGKHFSGKVTPLFPTMLVQSTEDEGEGSDKPSVPQPTPSPTHTSKAQGAGRNLGDQSSNDRSLSGSEDGMTLQSLHDICISLCKQVTGQAMEIKALKAQVKKLKRRAKPVINHHKAWLRATRLQKKRGVFKQGKKVVKSSKGEPSAHKDPAFDLIDDAMEYQETERGKDKESTDLHQGTDKENVSTDTQKVSADRAREEGTAEARDEQRPTPTNLTHTPTTFGDDETIAQVLLNMSQAKVVSREKEKGVELKDVENIERPRPTSTRSILTLKPLPKIDPKDKGKKRIEKEESDTESEGINESKKKFKMLAHDEEIARKMQEEWEVEEEKNRLAAEEAINAALIQEFNDVKARIEADRLLAIRLQEEERDQFTVEERAGFLHDTIAAQRRFLAEQRSATIRNKPPTKTQLRNQMITYLKHVGGKKHADLKNRNFDDIQALYERIKRNNDKFLAVGSTEDERKIKEMNEKAKDPGLKRLKKKVVQETPKEEETVKVPTELEVTEHGTKKRKGSHVKMIARKRPRPQPNNDSDDEHRKCLRVVAVDSVIDSEVMESKSVITGLNKVSSPDGDYLVIYRANGSFRAFNYLLEVLHIFDKQDVLHLYNLVMEQYSEITLDGYELILWGDLKIMMESSIEENDQIMSSSPHSTIVPSDFDIEDAFSSTNILNYFSASPGNIFPNPFEKISSPKDTETSVESPISISPSSSVGFLSPVRSTTPPPGYSFNELSNSVKISLWIMPRPLESELVLEEPNESNAC